MSLLFGGNLADRCGLVQTGSDKSGSLVFFLVGGHRAARCGQVWFLGVFLSWRAFGGRLRTAAESYGQV